MATFNPHITDRRHIPERRVAAREDGSIEPRPRAMGAVDWIAMLLLIVGGVNWGLVGAFGVDLVASILGEGTIASRVVYVLVGLSALYAIYTSSKVAGARV